MQGVGMLGQDMMSGQHRRCMHPTADTHETDTQQMTAQLSTLTSACIMSNTRHSAAVPANATCQGDSPETVALHISSAHDKQDSRTHSARKSVTQPQQPADDVPMWQLCLAPRQQLAQVLWHNGRHQPAAALHGALP